MLINNFSGKILEAGCDEAGRGCLAGPVVAAAVILSLDSNIEGLDDSKKMTCNQRKSIIDEIKKNAVAYAIASIDNTSIDKINILNASILAMHKALDLLSQKPEYIIIDGNKFKNYNDIPYETIIKGDAKFQSIAAASVLAKVYRDEYMINLHNEYPNYNWDKNKGYPTLKHKLAIQKFGTTKYHRLTFSSSIQLKLNFIK